MFTGIITATGRVKKIEKGKNHILSVETDKNFVKKAKLGSSIAVDGVCLTVIKILKNSLVFELMPETVRLTIANNYKIGTMVNLEHSMRVGSELGGHFVAGHVDGVGKVVKIKKESFAPLESPVRGLQRGGAKRRSPLTGDSDGAEKKEKESVVMTIKPPKNLSKYLAHKGSVAVNGVSLTLINQTSSAGVSRKGLQRGANMRRSPLTGDSDGAEGDTFNVSLVTYTLNHTNLFNLKIGSKVNVEVDLLARYLEQLTK